MLLSLFSMQRYQPFWHFMIFYNISYIWERPFFFFFQKLTGYAVSAYEWLLYRAKGKKTETSNIPNSASKYSRICEMLENRNQQSRCHPYLACSKHSVCVWWICQIKSLLVYQWPDGDRSLGILKNSFLWNLCK